jgi:iron complex outermembrane receptor protein
MSKWNGSSVADRLPLTLIGLSLGVGLPHGAFAAEAQAQSATLEEVVVTAERRAVDIQKTAAAISVRSGEELQSEGKYSLANILEDIPGMAGGASASPLGTGGSGTDNQAIGLVIRGIPSNVGVGGQIASVASAAAIYVDGIYEGVGGGYDIERVEALRGPQGTLYGRSATSGLVSIHTRNPVLNQFSGNVAVEAGNFGLRHYTGGVNIGLGDTVAVRISGNKYKRDGYIVKTGNTQDNTDGRVKLLFQPSDRFSLLLGAAYQKNATVGTGSQTLLKGTDGPMVTSATAAGPGENKYQQYWAEMKLDVGFGELSYLPALRKWTSTFDSLTHDPLAATGMFDQHSVTDKDDFWTHEVRLASKADSKLVWQVGSLYYDNKLHNTNFFNRFPSLAFYRNTVISRDTKEWGLFAEGTYPFATDWRVTAGARYGSTNVQLNESFTANTNCANSPLLSVLNSTTYCLPQILVTGTVSGAAGKRTYSKATYKLRFEHDVTASNMVYAMVSTGVSPGDVTMTTNAANVPVVKDIKSEVLTAYEIGAKNRFLDNRLQLNGDVFLYDYGAYTAANANVNGTRDAAGFFNSSFPPIFEAVSAPLRSYGLELEMLIRPTANDNIAFNYNFTNAYFTDVNKPIPGTAATFGDVFGYKEVPNLVPLRGSLSYSHLFHIGESTLSVGGSERWLGAHRDIGFLGVTRAQRAQFGGIMEPYMYVKSQFLTDLDVTWKSSKGMYSVTGWVRNAFDNRYKTTVNVSGFNAITVANGAAFNGITVVPSDPRTYGLVLNVNW